MVPLPLHCTSKKVVFPFLFFLFFGSFVLFLTVQDQSFRRKRQVSKQQGQREEPTLQRGPEVCWPGAWKEVPFSSPPTSPCLSSRSPRPAAPPHPYASLIKGKGVIRVLWRLSGSCAAEDEEGGKWEMRRQMEPRRVRRVWGEWRRVEGWAGHGTGKRRVKLMWSMWA